MYTEYFGLREPPFSIGLDPRFLYMSEQHREAFAHLMYGVKEGGGFVLLTGEVGTGKTTVCRCLVEQAPENTRIALILNPKISAAELLATICEELHLRLPADRTSIKGLVDTINGYLLESHGRGEHAVLILDEAQQLAPEVLEQVRLLTNLETERRKLLQIVMLGQPELRDTLARPELRQLAQRITARYHLEPLPAEEIGAYIQHRLHIAGTARQIFTADGLRTLHRLSSGVPRLINTIADRALLGAYSLDRKSVV